VAWDDGLEGAALEIAGSDADSLRVMAGPGTGKSFCMQRRVAKLLETNQVDPQSILAVTFTRNAAASLIADLSNIGIDGCDQIKASTLHAFCFGLLSSAGVFEQTGRVPRPLITITKSKVLYFEAAPLLADIMRDPEFGSRRDCTTRVRDFEAAWARLQSDQPGWPEDPIDQRFHRVLMEWLIFHEAMLIGELVPEALTFVRANPAHAAVSRFEHVIVDEYQDLNRAEQVLIDRLCRAACVAIVGDEDQSIYSFRNAHPEGIIEFDAQHPGTEDQSLAECRRCPTRVVALADHLIRHNHEPGGDARLTPMAGNEEGEIHVVQWQSVEEERDGLAQFVRYLIGHRNYEPGDVTILTPSRQLGYGIRNALTIHDIPAHSFYREEPLEAIESQRSFALLTLLVKPDDRVALRWWLGFGSGMWRRREYTRLRTYCEETGLSPREVLQRIVDGALEVHGITPLIDRYQELRGEIDELEDLSCSDLVTRLFPDEEEWAAPMREMAWSLLERIDEDDVAGLLDGLRTNITQPEMPDEGDFVRVMSLHKSKGLTSNVVLVTDCVEGLIPRLDDALVGVEAQRELQEQRRLFYVAVTRCTDLLVLSSVARLETALAHRIGARLRGRRGAVRPTMTSRFINELGPLTPDAIAGDEWVQLGFE
jgi:superfamily I DNA/RNA helicase